MLLIYPYVITFATFFYPCTDLVGFDFQKSTDSLISHIFIGFRTESEYKYEVVCLNISGLFSFYLPISLSLCTVSSLWVDWVHVWLPLGLSNGRQASDPIATGHLVL